MRCSIRKVLFRNISIAALFLSVGAALSSTIAHAQQDIFVVNNSAATIGEYTTSGGAVNAVLASGLLSGSPQGLALSGSNLFVANSGNGTIGEYSTSGATVNAAIVSGLDGPSGIVVSGSNVFVTNYYGNTIGEYATSGATVNAALVAGLSGPSGLVVSGSDLFVTNYNNGTIGEYTTSGGAVNAVLVSGLSGPQGIVVSGSNLFVDNGNAGTVGEYTTSGTVVNASLISGLNGPWGLAISGPNLFVTSRFAGTIGKYTTSGGTVNAALVSGLNSLMGIAVTSFGPLVNGAWANGSGGNWSASGNWSGGNVPGVSGNAADTATFGTTATSGTSVTVTLDTNPQLSAMTFSSASSYVLTANEGNLLTLSTSSGPASVTATAGSHTIACPLVLASIANFAPASGTQLTISGGISGTGGLALTNAGILILTGSNSYTGGTTINAGTLQVGAGGSGASIGSASGILDNATLAFNNADSTTFSGVISGTGALVKKGPGTLALTASNTYGGPTLIQGGVLRLVNTPIPSLAAAGAGTPLVWFDPSNPANYVLSNGTVSTLVDLGTAGNAGPVGLSGPTLTLSNSAFNGLTTLHFNGAQALGGFNLSALNNSSNTIFGVEGTTSGGMFLGSSYGGMNNAGLQFGYYDQDDFRWGQYNNDVNYTPAAPIYNGTSEVARQWTGNFNVSTGHVLYLNGSQVVSNTNTTGLTNLGSSDYGLVGDALSTGPYPWNLFFSGDVGEILVYPSSLTAAQQAAVQNYLDVKWGIGGATASQQAAANNLPVNTSLTISNGGTLDMTGGTQTIASLSSTDGLGSRVLLGSGALRINQATTTTFDGTISGSGGSLVKQGGGMLTLTGSNTYTGPTTINQGELLVNGLLVSPVTVNTGGMLGGSGSLTSVTVASGGSLSPGDPLGALTMSGSLVLSAGAALDFGLDTPLTSGTIACGSLVLNNQQFTDFNFIWTNNFAPGTYNLIDSGSVPMGSLGTSTSGTIDGLPANIAVQGDDVVLNVVPEPSTLALLGVAAVGLLGWGRRRRKLKRSS